MEKYKEQVQILATQILKGVGNDTDKATEGVKAINTILAQNPKIIPFISDENNRKEFEKLKMPKKMGAMEAVGLFGQIKELSKKFHNS